ncbi:hypothetical protein PtA15_14A265 [Puccinia triticina]|nr:uncharacterized protein PtA15_14A265 [Puccinia triticina]WAQ91382.1 hypothetical protein PtA15_14A265 [Puccinia triticina]
MQTRSSSQCRKTCLNFDWPGPRAGLSAGGRTSRPTWSAQRGYSSVRPGRAAGVGPACPCGTSPSGTAGAAESVIKDLNQSRHLNNNNNPSGIPASPAKSSSPLDKQKDDVASPSSSSLSTSSANSSCAAGGARRINSLSVIYDVELAAKLGDPDAQQGHQEDLKLAAKYYRMAANQGVEMTGSQWVWKDKLRILVATLALATSATLWLRCQQTDCLSLAGLGYLLIFDALGAANAVLFDPRPDIGTDRLWDALGLRDAGASIRLPFGYAPLPLIPLSVTSADGAIYVCKESVEHMMISHPDGPDNAGRGGGSHVGHSERHQSEMEILCTLVGSAIGLVLFDALVSRNHHAMALIAACGGEGTKSGGSERRLNPLSTLLLRFGLLVMFCGCFTSPSQSRKAKQPLLASYGLDFLLKC